jgi:glutamate carboxypeptidase
VEPEKGANAAVEIAHQVLAIHRFDERADDGISANVTVLRSGGKTNIIPDEAQASVDVRVARKSQIGAVDNFFRSLPDNTHVPGVVLSVSGGVDRPPMEADAATLELWALMEAEARRLGVTIEAIATGGCSDGNYTSAQGVPTIDGMGPVGANAHRSDEYVELDSVAPQVELIASLCKKIAKNSHTLTCWN